MSAYRFCRSDDIGALLVDALNHRRAPHLPGEPAVTAAAFKRLIRDLQVLAAAAAWSRSRASYPIGVSARNCAKRPSGTCIRIAVDLDHVRQGHGNDLLTSARG